MVDALKFFMITLVFCLNRESILFRATKTIDYVIKSILFREFISPWNVYWSTCNIWESYFWYSLWQFYGGKLLYLNLKILWLNSMRKKGRDKNFSVFFLQVWKWKYFQTLNHVSPIRKKVIATKVKSLSHNYICSSRS